jgi:O-antigen ligase
VHTLLGGPFELSFTSIKIKRVDILLKNPIHRIWPFTIILTMVILIPLAYSTHTFDKFGIIKQIIFLFGCGLLFCYLFFYSKELAGLPKRVAWIITLFIVVQMFQTLRLPNPWIGFWGEYGQSESLLVQVGFMILCLAAFLFIRPVLENRNRLVDIIALTVFIISGFGIIQYFLGDPITETYVARIKSFFGDPNSLGAFLVLTLPLITGGFWRTENKERRWMYCVSLFCGIIALYLTFSRAAWIGFGLIASFTFIWGISRHFLKDRTYRNNLIIIAAIMVIGFISGIIFTYFQPREHADYNLNARVSSMVKGNDSGRHLLWSIALDAFRHSPWIGDGMATFSKNFHQYQSIAATNFWKLNRNISQTHNELIQYLATQGLLGALAYLGLWLVLLGSGNIRELFRRNLDPERAGLWAAILGYWFFVQFAYPLIHYSFLIWIYWGLMLHNRHSAGLQPIPRRTHKLWMAIALIAVVWWGWFLANMFQADLYFQKAFDQARHQRFEASLANYQKAANLAPFQYKYHYRYFLTQYRAARYYRKHKQPEIAALFLQQAKMGTLKLLQQNPDDYQLHFLAGQITENQGDYHTACRYYRQALVLFPNNYQLQFKLAKTELLSGNRRAAWKAYHAGVRINPAYMKKVLRSEHLSEQDFSF